MPTHADLLKDLLLIQERLNTLFDEPDSGFGKTISPAHLAGCWTPAMDCYETDDKFSITAELPGVRREDIDLQVRARKIILSGERKMGLDVSKENYHRVECASGKFKRAFDLPAEIDASRIEAKLADGVLRVILPKRTSSSRQIRVEDGQ